MVRDTTEGKLDYLLVRDGPMYLRWVKHLTAGAKKYAKRNWMQARGQAEYDRFKESATRHFESWLAGERDEDHAAGVFFNINGAEYVRDQLAAVWPMPEQPTPYVTETSSLETPNVSILQNLRCYDRYSHGPHAWGKNDQLYCAGRRFDAT